MAGKIKYFIFGFKEVPLPVVEKEFWRLVTSVDDDVVVEYGADLHTLEHGSGFPMKDSSDDPEDEVRFCDTSICNKSLLVPNRNERKPKPNKFSLPLFCFLFTLIKTRLKNIAQDLAFIFS